MPFGIKKLEWLGYRTVKKSEDMVTRLDGMYERDRQTPHWASLDSSVDFWHVFSRGSVSTFSAIWQN